MCRLLGVVANRPVDLTYWMLEAPRSFRSYSDYHAHGWGMGYYTAGQTHLIKEPISALKSERFAPLIQSTSAPHYLCHIRKATCGEHTMCNSHPFQSGKFLFAHNGSIDRDYVIENLSPERLRAVEGQTDSEAYFQFLLQGLQTGGITGLTAAIADIRNYPYTALNFLLSDGARLFAFWQQSDVADPPYPEYYQLYFNDYTVPNSDIRETVVCSEKLDDSNWRPLPAGSLIQINSDLTWNLTPVA